MEEESSKREILKKPALSEAEGEDAKEVRHIDKGKILVMDDEEMVRDVIRETLRHLKYEFETAKEGREAIESYKRAMESNFLNY
jgi:PleD family two-component response regulator